MTTEFADSIEWSVVTCRRRSGLGRIVVTPCRSAVLSDPRRGEALDCNDPFGELATD